MSFFKDTNIFLAFFRILLACVAGGRGCARETFCGEAANSLAGVTREGIVASGEALAKLELKIRVRLLPTLLATCAAFSTRVRDRSARGYPLPPATQASILFENN